MDGEGGLRSAARREDRLRENAPVTVQKDMATDADIRDALRQWLSNRHRHRSNILLIEELGVSGGAKVGRAGGGLLSIGG